MTAETLSAAEKFAPELAVAFDSIETLTKNECAFIITTMNVTRCEPLFAFLCGHIKLGYVLASPHGRSFAAALRAWGANRMIDAALVRHWPMHYRPRYRAGAEGELSRLKDVETVVLIGERNPERVHYVLRNLRSGDVFRWRLNSWPENHWCQCEFIELTKRGLLRVNETHHPPHPRAKRGGRPSTLSPDILDADNCVIELLSRSAQTNAAAS